MNKRNSISFSQGVSISNVNGNIDKTSYKAMYSGNKGKMLVNNNDKSYYIEADENDMNNIFGQPTDKRKLTAKLTKLMKKSKKKSKKKMRYTVKKAKKVKIAKQVKKRPVKKRSVKKRPVKKRPVKKRPVKKRSFKNPLQNLLSNDMLKTIL